MTTKKGTQSFILTITEEELAALKDEVIKSNRDDGLDVDYSDTDYIEAGLIFNARVSLV